MKVAVCVITYQRPQGLRRLLDGLNRITFAGAPPDVRCIVVDNDEAGSARAVCDEVRRDFRWTLEYYVEPRRGIPQARNAAIAQAGTSADFVAFIDDDEVPDPAWLGELLRVQHEHDADVVTGPSVPHFLEKPPRWVVKGGFFAPPERPTGQRLDRSATGNVLIRSGVLRAMDSHFDERMAMTGGSDIRFFRRVHRAGFTIVWTNEAVAREWIPISRMKTGWILQRAFRYGANTAAIERELRSPLGATLVLLALGCYKLAKGLFFLLPMTCLRGRAGAVFYAWLIWAGAGVLAGLVGHRYEEYRRIHGD